MWQNITRTLTSQFFEINPFKSFINELNHLPLDSHLLHSPKFPPKTRFLLLSSLFLRFFVSTGCSSFSSVSSRMEQRDTEKRRLEAALSPRFPLGWSLVRAQRRIELLAVGAPSPLANAPPFIPSPWLLIRALIKFTMVNERTDEKRTKSNGGKRGKPGSTVAWFFRMRWNV